MGERVTTADVLPGALLLESPELGAIGAALALDRADALERRRRVPFGFACAIPCGHRIDLILRPRVPLLPKRLLMSGSASHLQLEDLRVGDASYLLSEHPIPLEFFVGRVDNEPDPIDWRLPAVRPGQELILSVYNFGAGTAECRGAWLCLPAPPEAARAARALR